MGAYRKALPDRHRLPTALLLAAAALCGCRTATSLEGHRDLLTEAVRPEGVAARPRPLVERFCSREGTVALREALALRTFSGAPPDLVVEGEALLTGTGVGPLAATGIYAWDILVGIPATVLPLPIFYSGKWDLGVRLIDRETGLARGAGSERFIYRGTTYWVWGLIGKQVCLGEAFAPLAVPPLEAELVRVARPEVVRRFLESARGEFLEDQVLLDRLAAGKDALGDAPPALERMASLRDRPGTPRVVLMHLDLKRVTRGTNAEGDSQRPAVRSEGRGKAVWGVQRRIEEGDLVRGPGTRGIGVEPLALVEYAWSEAADAWVVTRVAPEPAALRRAQEGHRAAIQRVEERLRALGP